jgi:hypothetical protein
MKGIDFRPGGAARKVSNPPTVAFFTGIFEGAPGRGPHGQVFVRGVESRRSPRIWSLS